MPQDVEKINNPQHDQEIFGNEPTGEEQEQPRSYEDESYSEPSQEPQAEGEQGEEAEEQRPKSRYERRVQELVEERNRERQQREELAKKIEQFQGLQEQINQWYTQQQGGQGQQQQEQAPQPPEFPKPPEYLDDEVKQYFQKQQEFFSQREQALKDELERLKGGYSEQQELTQQQQAQQQVAQIVQQQQAQFAKEAPDYLDALEHIRGLQRQTLMEDYGLTEQEANQHIAQDEWSRVVNAIQRNQDAAKITYNMAKRMGYQPKQQEQQQGQEAMEQGDAPRGTESPKGRASVNMGGGNRMASLDDLGNKNQDEFQDAMKELFSEFGLR